MRMPQGLEISKARAMNPITCHGFYSNLLQQYSNFTYHPSHIWNVDESGINASKSGLGKVLARKGIRNVHAQIPNEREWLSVLTSINAAGASIPHFFIFKGKRRLQDYIQLCGAGTTMAMQENGYMTSYLFSRWMDHFIEQLEELGNLSPSNRHLIVLDGHKSHLTLDVIQKAKEHGVDMISLPSHTSHALQPLDVACFKPFKSAFKAYRNKFMMQNNEGKVDKNTLAHWVDLALKKALSKSNIVAGFRATGIWPLNLERMEAKVGPSRSFQSTPSCKLIVEEIMEEDLPSVEDDVLHYYVEDEVEVSDKGSAGPEIAAEISHFLKLPQKPLQATRIVHEPLVDYSRSQILTSDQHIESMEVLAKKKGKVAQERVDKARAGELTKVKKAAEKALKDATRIEKAAQKEKREATLKKWKENDNGGQRTKILQLLVEGDHNCKKIQLSMPWQKKINQRIAKAKLNAKKKRKESGVPLPSFPPLMEFPHSLGFHSPCVTPTPFRFSNAASAPFRSFTLPQQVLHPPPAPMNFPCAGALGFSSMSLPQQLLQPPSAPLEFSTSAEERVLGLPSRLP